MRVWVSDNNALRPDRFLKLIRSWLGILLFLFTCTSSAAEYSSEITRAELIKKDKYYALDAGIELNLSPVAKKAIDSSIILSWQLQLELKQQRQWQDKILIKRIYDYQIRYHALLNSYSVKNQTTDEIQRFSSLEKAINGLSQIHILKVFSSSLIKPQENYSVAIKLFLNREALPVPLRVNAYFKTEWDLSSDWYVWNLNQ